VSACKDDQTAAEEPAAEEPAAEEPAAEEPAAEEPAAEEPAGGVFSNALLEILSDHAYCVRLKELMLELSRRLAEKNAPQEPRLTASRRIDTDTFLVRRQTPSFLLT
jgi:hypothetical protein